MYFFSKEVISNPCLNKDPQPGMNSGCLKNHKSTNKTKNAATAASSNLEKITNTGYSTPITIKQLTVYC